MGKERLEQWLYDIACVEVKHFHGNNGIFSWEEYRLDCSKKKQPQSLLGVGAQHQNSKAERAIQTIMYMACTFLVHSSLHWTDMGADHISLWTFSVKHVVWFYNRVPNYESGLTRESSERIVIFFFAPNAILRFASCLYILSG